MISIKLLQQVSGKDDFLVSHDVCSLFTSVMFKETITKGVELIFENNQQLKVKKCELKLKQLFNFATSGTHLIFNSSFYEQNDGVSVGSPLGPAPAHLFMGYHKKEMVARI